MQEEEIQDPEKRKEHEEIHKERISKSSGIFLKSIWSFISSILSLADGLDKEATMEGIRKDVEFRGHAAWILICSIIIACIGLGTGSAAVIIGAMLISPLMGPILGMGLATAINDMELLKKSALNFLIAIVISVLISYLYFFFLPVPQINLELAGRKEATVLAIGVALMGGLAGIIAGSRRYKNNVVPGVAIATALMPPLCTVGFGLATRNWEYAYGAAYLFFINSVFIALPTYLYIWYMKFPMKEFMDPIRQKRIKQAFAVFIIIVIVPSGYLFYRVIQRDFFQRDIRIFVEHVKQDLAKENVFIIEQEVIYEEDHKELRIALMGKTLPDETIDAWKADMASYKLENTELKVVQNQDFSETISSIQQQSAQTSKEFMNELLFKKEDEIRHLESEIAKYQQKSINFEQISKEIKILAPELESLAYAEMCETNFELAHDTIPTLMVRWQKGVTKKDQKENEQRLEDWIRQRLDAPEFVVRSY